MSEYWLISAPGEKTGQQTFDRLNQVEPTIILPINYLPGAQLGNFERGGRRYICKRKDEVKHGLSPAVKCVAPLSRDMSLAKI